MSTTTVPSIDRDEIKRATRGRWPEVLSALGGIPADLLDGRHHPCPKCGGTDRFRMIDEDAGALLCNQCFSTKNGDGFAALQWLTGRDFQWTLKAVADHLGFASTRNGDGNGNGEIDVVWLAARAKRMPYESFLAYGAHVARRKTKLVARVPVYNEHGIAHSYFDLTSNSKGWFKKREHKDERTSGLFLPGRPPKPEETWLLVEGVKDAAALHGLGFLACGLPRNEMSPKYARLFQGANVIIVPDRDKAGEDGAKNTARRLHGTASSVRIAILPAEYRGTGGEDVRDVLAKRDGEQLVRQAIEDAQEWNPEEADEEKAGIVKQLADEICARDHFAKDAGGKLYHYSGGVYRRQGEAYIKERVKAWLHIWEDTKKWSRKLSEEVIEWIRVDAPELWERPPIDVINVKNGLLDVADQELRDHTPEHLSTVQLPVKYDPKATCPATDKFDAEVFPDDAIELAHEIVGWLMAPDTSIQKAILLIGEGGNGKSRKLEQIRAFLGGRANTAAVSLHKLEANRFSVARLIGKLANICPDLPSAHLAGTSVFKAITGGDELEAEYKFRDSFAFRPFCRLVFSANHPPRSEDASEAFFDRWLVIKFDARFRGTDQEIPASQLDAKLQSPSELSGLLNHALDGLNRIRQRGRLSEPKSVQDAREEFRATTDPLAVWLDRFTVEDPKAVTPRKVIRTAFGAVCEAKGRPVPTDTLFGRAFRKLRPNVEVAQRTVNGRLQKCYVGIGLRKPGFDDSPTSPGSPGSPYLNLSRGTFTFRDQEKQKLGGVEQSKENPVNPVNMVEDDDNQATNKRGWV